MARKSRVYPSRLEYFLSKVGEVKANGCQEWTASLNKGGYGNFYMNGAMTIASRAAWMLLVGPIKDASIFVCHKCDNRKCVRVEHLFLGTREDNRQDCINKGRHAKGAQHSSVTHPEKVKRGEGVHCAKVTDEDVRDIRTRYAAGDTQRNLMREYGISSGAMSQIVTRKSWKHVA